MPHQGQPCVPAVFNYGVDLDLHDQHAKGWYYVVFRGIVPGIYLNSEQALAQTLHQTDYIFKKFRTQADALGYWNQCCRENHDHGAPAYKVKGIPGTFITFDEAIAAAATEFIKEV
ncbi:hypothetical protein DFH07DRAFT_969015 [Mycena maculata]|uniref:Ribonuclease H1 N-terminal domain-containing protein n=1 Tax=Mycena maculata TaxID=230809 RepID=A0AAD7MU86_9AGAR|nr:hypothetical protein DFH07DRAFT_969015 [Mycena maculata]